MNKKTSVTSRVVRAGKRLTLILGLVATLAFPVSASASSHKATSPSTHFVRPADDGVGDSPLVP